MKKSFSETEKKILLAFTPGSTFKKNGIKHTVLLSGKPVIKKGECKTDIYIKTCCNKNVEHEFKISVKQENADFLENKISLERANEILGLNSSQIIKNSTLSISDKFERHKLIEFKKKGPTIIIGWKFEFMNKLSGEKSGQINLNSSQIYDIYSGKNLNENKRNAFINNKEVQNSGIADYMLIVKGNANKNSQEYIDEIIKISDYIKTKNIYFACKALNYRVREKKWDGDRPLSVWVHWYIENQLLRSNLNFDKPLENKGNNIGKNIENILLKLQLNSENFEREIHKFYNCF